MQHRKKFSGVVIQLGLSLAERCWCRLRAIVFAFSCFVEKYPGQAKRWFFHLPALGPNGTIIRLVSGIILAWDGREVLHCTGMSPDGTGVDNMLHGYFVVAR